MVTMKDIAMEAGVARQTVSGIINDENYKVSKDTRSRVMRLVKDMGYHPNQFARSLKTGKTQMVGIISVENSQLGNPVTIMFNDPYMAELYTGIGSALSEQKYRMVFQCLNQAHGRNNSIELAQTSVVDGLIFVLLSEYMDNFVQDCLPVLKSQNIPFVVTHSLKQTFDFPAVGVDCRNGGYLAAGHLLEHGYESIGFVRRKHPVLYEQDMFDGYKAALQEAGHTVPEEHLLECDGMYFTQGYDAARTLLDTGRPLPRALVTISDAVAKGMMKCFHERGIRVPEDVALIGYGDFDQENFNDTVLTSIVHPAREKGEAVAGMLQDIITTPQLMEKPENVVLNTELKLRRSCGCSGSNTE